MKSPEKYKEEEFKKLVELIGEKEARKYMQKDYFSPTAIGLAIFFAKTKKYAQKNPTKFLLVLLLIITILFFVVYDNFFY